MDTKKSYCEYCNNLKLGEDDFNKEYHDKFYGFPVKNDNELFERLTLEIFQAGLSWITILKKQKNFERAFDNFDIKKVAKFGESDNTRLLSDAGIIRNKLKIIATIYNANQIIKIQKENDSFKNWLDLNKKLDLVEWTKLFKKTFKFTGGEIIKEFLLSTGYLPNAHDKDCPVKDLQTNLAVELNK